MPSTKPRIAIRTKVTFPVSKKGPFSADYPSETTVETVLAAAMSHFRVTDDAQFDPSMGRLVKALDADLEAARAHTRWLVKALEWESEDRDNSFLLRGSELKSAEGWLASSSEAADPAPTPLQREYLLASRDAANRRQRVSVGASLLIAVVSIGLLIFALISRGQAVPLSETPVEFLDSADQHSPRAGYGIMHLSPL